MIFFLLLFVFGYVAETFSEKFTLKVVASFISVRFLLLFFFWLKELASTL